MRAKFSVRWAGGIKSERYGAACGQIQPENLAASEPFISAGCHSLIEYQGPTHSIYVAGYLY